MLIDAAQLEDGARIEAGLCVIGAGAAGIAIARALRGSGLDVVLLEAGGFYPSTESQSLYEGEMATLYRDDGEDASYVVATRLRYFGGTTGHWMGWCMRLEPEDLEERPWIPHSGWPLTAAELASWYEPALSLVQIPPFEPDHGAGRRGRRRTLLAGRTDVATRIYHFSPPTRFGTRYRADIVEAPDVRLLLGVSVLRLRTTPDGHAVDRIEAVGPNGRALEVRPRACVLAAGGIENARILLLSDADRPSGLGNERDLVGRFFMEHSHLGHYGLLAMHGEGGGVAAPLYQDRARDDVVGVRTQAVFVLPGEVKRRERLQGFSVAVPKEKDKRVDDLARAVGGAAAAIDRLGEGGRVADPPGVAFTRLGVRAEQRPNPDSRVTLAREKDRLGLRKVRLDWRLSAEDAASIRRSAELFAAAVGAGALGRVRLDVNTEYPWGDVKGGAHHIGTTRMADDPARGVVDGDCRVHGLDNLWIAGSSVFPTCGCANPTLTIVALALRLADHLAGKLGNRPGGGPAAPVGP